MKYPCLLSATLAAGLWVGAASAQVTPAVITDAGQPPAEERDSNGAIVLENSMVRAQQRAATFQRASQTMSVDANGRPATRGRATTSEPATAERELQQQELRRMGASPAPR